MPRRARGRIVAIEGLSGAGKSFLLRGAREAPGTLVLEEAWQRLRPRPSLSFRSVSELLPLELQLLREDCRRWNEAARATASGLDVYCDTDFVGPALYTAALAQADPELAPVAKSVLEQTGLAMARHALGVADLYLYLDTPATTAGRRAAAAAGDHPARWRARHAEVGAVERAFWLGSAPALLPGRVRVLDGRARPSVLLRALRGQVASIRRRRPNRAAQRLVSGVRRFVLNGP